MVNDTTIKDAIKGDEFAFKQIFLTYGDFVYSTALRILSNSHDAEEIVQEVFVSMHNKIKSFKFESKLKTWIYRITVNTALNYAKKNTALSKKKFKYINTINNEQIPSDNNKLYNDFDKEQNTDTLDKMLSVLTPEQKVCLLFRTKEDLSYKEISQIVGISVDSVRSRIKRAREKLLTKRKDFTDAM